MYFRQKRNFRSRAFHIFQLPADIGAIDLSPEIQGRLRSTHLGL